MRISHVLLLLINLFFFVYLIVYFIINHKQKELFNNNNGTTLFSCDTKCNSTKRQLTDWVNYNAEQDMRPEIDFLILVGKPNNEDIPKLIGIQRQIHKAALSIFHNLNDFIVFFDKPNFEGRFYLIPSRIDNWKAKTVPEEETSNSSSISLEAFVHSFSFYFGRHFSCIIPDHIIIHIIPLQRDNVASDPVILRKGKHNSVRYYKSVVREFKITSD